jgi:hypothetical protein
MPKKSQYKIIDIGNPTKPNKTRYAKILKQIPEGKTIEITESTFNQPSNKALVKIIDPEDIPPPTHIRKHMPPEIKDTLTKIGFKNVTKTGKPKTQKNK